MVKITVTEDCGNAPKKQFVKDFCIALAHANIAVAMDMLADDVHVEIPGYESASGKQAVENLIVADSKRSKVSELVIDNILSHGDRCAANGLLKFEDGGLVAFCNIYVFNGHGKNAKLKEIIAYSIELKR